MSTKKPPNIRILTAIQAIKQMVSLVYPDADSFSEDENVVRELIKTIAKEMSVIAKNSKHPKLDNQAIVNKIVDSIQKFMVKHEEEEEEYILEFSGMDMLMQKNIIMLVELAKRNPREFFAAMDAAKDSVESWAGRVEPENVTISTGTRIPKDKLETPLKRLATKKAETAKKPKHVSFEAVIKNGRPKLPPKSAQPKPPKPTKPKPKKM